MQMDSILKIGRLPIGIEVAPREVRMLQVARSRAGLRAVAAAVVPLLTPALGRGSEAWAREVADAVHARISGGGFVGRRCVLSVDSLMTRVRSVRYPRMPDEELARAVSLDGPARLGFSEQDGAEVGWIRAGEVRQGDEFREEVIVVGGRRSEMQRLVLEIAGRGMRPESVEPGFAACARTFSRFLRRESDQGTVRLIVEVGASSTNVIFIKGRRIVFHKPIEIGGDDMNLAAGQKLGVEPASMMDMRRQRMTGHQVETRVDRAIFEAVRPTLADIANEVSLCMRYFGVSFRGLKPDMCLLVGAEAHEPQFLELMGEAIHVPACIGKPLQGVDLSGIVHYAGYGLESDWSTATGLALALVKNAASNPRPSTGADLRAASANDPLPGTHEPRKEAA